MPKHKWEHVKDSCGETYKVYPLDGTLHPLVGACLEKYNGRWCIKMWDRYAPRGTQNRISFKRLYNLQTAKKKAELWGGDLWGARHLGLLELPDDMPIEVVAAIIKHRKLVAAMRSYAFKQLEK